MEFNANEGLSYFERITLNAQPHENFNTDWLSYSSLKFADIFLPKVDELYAKGFNFFDGAEIFDGVDKIQSELLTIEDNNKIISFAAYSFPKGVEASIKKERVQPAYNEVCFFVEVDEGNNTEITFKYGTDFKSFLDKNAIYINNNLIYKSNVDTIKRHFDKKLSHENLTDFVFKAIGVNTDLAYGNTEKGRLETYLKKNKIQSFVYKNFCGGNTHFVIQGTIINGWLELKRIDTAQITTLTGINADLKDSILLLKQNDSWSEATLFISKTGKPCNTKDSPITGDEIETINQEVTRYLNYQNQKGNEKLFTEISNEIAKKVTNDFYKDVKIQVNLTIDEDSKSSANDTPVIDSPNQDGSFSINTNTVPAYVGKFTNTDKNPEVFLYINIDKKGTVTIHQKLDSDYLKANTSFWDNEIQNRGLDGIVHLEDLRQQVIEDFESDETKKSFLKNFIQNTKALLNENVGSYVEAIQATQKVAKNVWDDGQMPKDTWLSSDPSHQKWPAYMQLNPLIGGATDGVIDEIVGIPMAIKGIYGIATEEEQRKALLNLFTAEGASQLIDGLKEDAEATLKDEDRLQHFGAQTTVSVAATLLGIGIFTKGGKVAKVLNEVTEKITDFVNPKALKFFEYIKKGNRKLDTDEAISKLSKEIGDDLFEDVLVEAGETALEKGRKLTLEELQAFWKRGNDFNKKAKDNLWYNYHELWLEHPTKKYPKGHKFEGKPRRFRVDSYDTDGIGKIVSRKATNLNEIEFSTFERYCKEIKEKYPVGSKIARKEDDLGDTLKGEYILEIPESNKNFDKINDYIKFAKELNPPVTIIFKTE